MKNDYNVLKRSSKKLLFLKTLAVLLLTGLCGVSAVGQTTGLTLRKYEMNDSVSPGDMVTYQLVYINGTAIRQQNVIVTDTYPENLEYISSVPIGAKHNSTARTVTFDKDVLSDFAELSSGSGVLYVNFRVGKPGEDFSDTNHYKNDSIAYYLSDPPTITPVSATHTKQQVVNSASIKSDNLPTPYSNTNNKVYAHQFCEARITQASPGALKSDTGNEYEYLVTITNTGNVYNKYNLETYKYNGPYPYVEAGFPDITQSSIADNVTPSLRRINYLSTDPPLTETGWMAPGEIFTFILHIKITGGTPPSLPNNRAQDALSVVKATSVLCNQSFERIFRTGICTGNGCGPGVNVGAYKYDIPDPVESGSILEYNLVLFNGYVDNKVPAAVSGIRLKDIFPSSVYVQSIVSVDAPVSQVSGLQYTYDAANHTWTFQILPPKMTTIKVKVQLQQNIPNNTVIENKLELYYDPTSTTIPVSTYIEKTTVISAPDLWIQKTADKVNVTAGDIITYTITYGNTGSYFAGLTEIYDDYDETNLEIINTGGGTISSGKIKWNLGNIPIGGTGTVSYTARVRDGSYPAGSILVPNTANIQDANTWRDKNYSDNISNWFVNLTTLPDLKLTKTVDQEGILALNTADGNTLTYTITIENIGVADLTAADGGYKVTDHLPAGLTYVSDNSLVTPTNASGVLTWDFSDAPLAVNASHTFNMVVKGVTFSQIGKTLKNVASVELISTLSEASYTNNKDSVETDVYRNLWVGLPEPAANGTKWDLASNWTYGVPGTPGLNNDVEFATPDNYLKMADNHLFVDDDATLNQDGANDGIKTIDSLINVSNKALIIPTYKTLIINEKAKTGTTGAENRIVIKSKVNEANGALIFTKPDDNTEVKATVEYDSRSQKVTTGTYPREWQYIGTPVSDATPASVFGSNVSGSKYGPLSNVLIRKHDESKNDPNDIGDKWVDVTVTDPMTPFAGYEVVQPTLNTDTAVYRFKGTLNVGDFYTDPLTFTPTAYYRGNYILANSYVAPIDISKLGDAFENLDGSIYLYNTGSRDQWLEKDYGYPTVPGNPGTYFAVPYQLGETLEVNEIPSLNGFMVRSAPGTGSVSKDLRKFKFTYASLKTPGTSVNKPMYVKAASAPEKKKDTWPLLMIDVKGTSGVDRVHLITAPNTTKGFDNGWDGVKYRTQTDAQIYALATATDRYQVSTDADLDGTILGFYNGTKETAFTLTFRMKEMDNVYNFLELEDLETGAKTNITDGGTFRFNASALSPEARFRINGTPAAAIPTGLDGTIEVKYYKNNEVVVFNGSDEEGTLSVFDVAGKVIFDRALTTGQTIEKLKLKNGVYILEARTKSYRTTLKVIIQ